MTTKLWSRGSRGGERLDDLGSVATRTGEKTRSRKGGPQFPGASVER